MLSSILLLASSCHAPTATLPQGHTRHAADKPFYHKTISDMTKQINSLAEDGCLHNTIIGVHSGKLKNVAIFTKLLNLP